MEWIGEKYVIRRGKYEILRVLHLRSHGRKARWKYIYSRLDRNEAEKPARKLVMKRYMKDRWVFLSISDEDRSIEKLICRGTKKGRRDKRMEREGNVLTYEGEEHNCVYYSPSPRCKTEKISMHLQVTTGRCNGGWDFSRVIARLCYVYVYGDAAVLSIVRQTRPFDFPSVEKKKTSPMGEFISSLICSRLNLNI